MEIELGFVLLFFGTFTAIRLVQSQNQEGFISLDCGLEPKDFSYTQKRTNISYISDANFISYGVSSSIKEEYKKEFQQQAWFLRSFPEGNRNCYDLNLTKNSKYLIRATFVYGNYDDLSQIPSFDLHIGPNKWTTVEIPGVLNGTIVELVHVLKSNNLQVCLVKTGPTIPFISSLEIRPLKNTSYVTKSGSLNYFSRFYVTTGEKFIRFDDDVHDRLWGPYFDQDWTIINTTLFVNTSNTYEPPLVVMRTAAVPVNASKPLTVSWSIPDTTSQMYVYMHFAEIEMLNSNETREFSINLNGEPWFEPSRPSNFSVMTIYSLSPDTSRDGTYVVSLEKTNRSTLPPLLNAMEIYTVVEFPQSETDQNEVDAMTNIKSAYGLNKVSWQGDPCAPQDYKWEGLNCSYNGNQPPRIKSLNLSSSGLTGKIAPYIQDLTQLLELDLSKNSLTGEVPEFLANMTSLLTIDLSGNKLNGSIPPPLLQRIKEKSLNLNIEGNQIVCPPELCNNKKIKNKHKVSVVPVAASVASLTVLIALVATILIIRRQTQKSPRESCKLIDQYAKERRFTYPEIQRMTNNFEKILGKGGFATVYLGCLEKTQVAVKVLTQARALDYKQFKAEVELLLRVHHKNLVGLVGYSDDGRKLALIYEFMENGDLKQHLSGKHHGSPLSWVTRLRIAAEAAQGLEYLHHGSKPKMVHRDVKTANILLNEHFEAKIADFGLTRSFPVEGQTHVSTVVAGTPGYLDPEYFATQWLTEKSDVYAFGVLLLEIVTNQPPINNARDRPHIIDWVSLMINRGDIRNIIDPEVQGEVDPNIVWKAVELAMACVNQSSARRPTMTLVAKELNVCLTAEKARTNGSQETE